MGPVKLQTDVNVHAETVNAALATEDYAPLVRMVFDAFSASLNTSTTKESLLMRPSTINKFDGKGDSTSAEDSAAAGRRASDRTKVLRKRATEPLVQALEQVLDAKSTELSQICRGNAEHIASSLQELGSMQSISQELKKRITEGDVALRQAGGKVLSGLDQLQELNRVATAVSESCQAVGATRQLLALCTQAGRAVNGNELYKAFCFLQRAQTDFLGGSLDPGGSLVLEEDTKKLSRTVRLHQFVSSKILEMETAMQEKAISDFNNWLVSVRREAKAVGLASIRRAAWQRTREESLAAQRRRLASELSSIVTLNDFAASLAKPLPQMSKGTATLDPRIHPTAAAVLADVQFDPSEDLMKRIEMTPLHRCLQIHSCLGRSATFKAYYQTNRKTQLSNDLAANVNFVQQYESYIAQVVGYFVIEDRVARSTDAMSGQIDAGWETAVAYLKPALETTFLSVTNPTTSMAIKDMMLLACSALRQCGYHVAPLLDVLLNGKAPYYDLISREIEESMQGLVEARGQTACAVFDAEQAAKLSGTLGLPLVVPGKGRGKGDLGPTPPFTAPFSQMLPETLWQARRYVEDVAAYVWGLMSQSERLSHVRLQRDSMLTNSLLGAIGSSLSEIPIGDPSALYYALQTVADLNCFSEALQALDDFTYLTVRGVHPLRDGKANSQKGSMGMSVRNSNLPTVLSTVPSHIGHSTALHPTYSIRAHQTCQPELLAAMSTLTSQGEQKAQAVLTHRVQKIITRLCYKDWEPAEPIRHAGDHSELLKALVELLQDSLEQLQRHMNDESYVKNARALVKTMGDGLLGMMLSDSLEGFNIYSVFALTDDSLALLEACVASKIPAIEVGLLEIIQICDVLASGRIDDMLNESKRTQNYPAINLRNFQAILRKFREVKQKSGSSPLLSRSKQPESFLKRKAVEKVAKLLRL